MAEDGNPVEKFYDENAEQEWQRLEKAFSRLEFASAMNLINKYFPKRGQICDIGSGPGRYAIELLLRGYDVTLVDVSHKLLELARIQITKHNLRAHGYLHTDASDLGAFGENVFDAALMMGPQYHLTDRGDRLCALRELKRVLKDNGIAIITYLNGWGLVRSGISDFPEQYEDRQFVYQLFGVGNLDIWHYTTPQVALGEIAEAELKIVTYAGAQGFAGGMKPLIEKLADENPVAYENVIQTAIQTSELPEYRDACEHLHIVVTIP
ncbi:MAG: class I SAM-dependent methyltransferase [Chloroflexi bacterium]|nr:MAG: class I SAM-dependent methyltransferase [Chloroflexota bacterium]